IAITPDGATAYIGGSSGLPGPLPQVTPIDLATKTVGTPIPLGTPGQVQGIAITPDGHTAYVITAGSQPGITGELIAIDIGTNTNVGNTSLSRQPRAIGIVRRRVLPSLHLPPGLSAAAIDAAGAPVSYQA